MGDTIDGFTTYKWKDSLSESDIYVGNRLWVSGTGKPARIVFVSRRQRVFYIQMFGEPEPIDQPLSFDPAPLDSMNTRNGLWPASTRAVNDYISKEIWQRRRQLLGNLLSFAAIKAHWSFHAHVRAFTA